MKSKEQFVAPHNGAFTRVLGHYWREQKVLDLPSAIRKMTLLPAQRLEAYAPVFRGKGRIQPGMDADITVFDASTIKDNASYRDPYREATGLSHVIVNGQVVIRNSKLVPDIYPGRRLTAPGNQ